MANPDTKYKLKNPKLKIQTAPPPPAPPPPKKKKKKKKERKKN